MCSTSDRDDPKSPTNSDRLFKWLPLVCAFLGFFGLAELISLLDRSLGHQYEILPLITSTSVMAAIGAGLLILLRATNCEPSRELAWRVFSTVCFSAIGFKVGARYVHLCGAGFRWIEGSAMLGTPLLAGIIVFASKGRLRGCILAACLFLVVWLLARPYLDWVHGN